MHVTLRGFIALSFALHAGAGVLIAIQPADPAREVPPAPDRFAGEGVEVDALPLPAVAPAAEPPAEATPNATRTPEVPPAPAARAAPVPKPPGVDPAPGPRVQRSPRVKPEATRAESDPASASSAASSSGFGSGLPPGVRHLPNAFTRALAIANRGDRRWRDLPFGRAGEVRLRLAVNEAGELGELEFPNEQERDRLEPVVRHLLDNTLLLLRSGRFSLDPRKASSGVARLRVMVEVTERKGANPDGDPSELFGVAWEAPSGDRPGKSGFILNSGRQVTAWVWVE